MFKENEVVKCVEADLDVTKLLVKGNNYTIAGINGTFVILKEMPQHTETYKYWRFKKLEEEQSEQKAGQSV